MNVQVSVQLKWAFVVRPDTIKRIWEMLESRVGSVSATARCADDARREFLELSKLLDFDNAKGKQVRSLELSAHSQSFERTADLTFGGRPGPIELSLKGGESDTSQLKRDVLDVLDGTKAWYSVIGRIDVGLVLIALFAALWLIGIFASSDRSEPRLGVPLSRALVLASEVVLALGSIFAAFWLIHVVQARYFAWRSSHLGRVRHVTMLMKKFAGL